MICQRCRTSLLSRLQPQHTVAFSASLCARQLPIHRSQFRNYSDGKPTVSATPPSSVPRQPVASDITIPSAISSATPGVSQPLSTPEEVHIDAPTKPTKAAAERPPSSCPAGTKLNGLNYFKNKPDVVALEDSEYPEWLWSLLDDAKKQSKSEGGVDPSTLNKKQRKRYEKKMAARAATLPPKIPVHHHATDITPAPYNRGDQATDDLLAEAAESLEKRSEITKSAREARRKAIREANFLRGL
ncbi:hypothetical protein ETB97_006606 [Aspergillus alliaceus]|uniref:Large ribosomal subunit protein mL54 n=1 Tax=Petromyces alliaceus TaxID=209559 RepID=A0A5N7CA02_PETAA|nr:mitochondrial ribosomal protein L37-domain-containing protein [Aspergillus alliaceus]KAB8237076.1 mitochondrial ribosomal protein L37-domain-containing protein [Aspergillus alliaceus]KAE8390970.1 mitochondrial ribosomal protein L37-domain-containing protein [Aspergillus alliaceus]KAF5864761.1 hypothetical protein ETB97_006606 [Aspergillus burnettii]